MQAVFFQKIPKTRFNVAIGLDRIVAFGSLPLDAMKSLGKMHGCSLNDVFTALCGGGLRRYLSEKSELPEEPLIGGIPVSLHKPGDVSMHNEISLLMCSLATDLKDPVERMLAIRDAASKGKKTGSRPGRNQHWGVGFTRVAHCFSRGHHPCEPPASRQPAAHANESCHLERSRAEEHRVSEWRKAVDALSGVHSHARRRAQYHCAVLPESYGLLIDGMQERFAGCALTERSHSA